MVSMRTVDSNFTAGVSENSDADLVARFGCGTTIDECIFHIGRRGSSHLNLFPVLTVGDREYLFLPSRFGETMSTEESVPGADVQKEDEGLFEQLPAEVSGWEQYSRESSDSVFEYWKKGSTHIGGQYEQVIAKELRDGDVRVTKRTYDQFNHLLNTRTLIEKSQEAAARLWRTAKERMEEFPANEPFDSPPEMPTAFGEWELISERHEEPRGETVWERPFGEAAFVVEETDVVAHYSHTKRPHQIRYREPDTDAEVVVDDVPRTSAFEMASNSLDALSAPLSEMGSEQDALQSVKGIGPAKSRQFILLGITSPSELKTHLEVESSPVNHHHDEAIEKLLTATIREQFA